MGNNYKKNTIIYNNQIRFDTLRVIDKDRTPLGIMKKAEAIKLAESQDLDLVLIVAKADPPVARVIDLNKYKYEIQKTKRKWLKKPEPHE